MCAEVGQSPRDSDEQTARPGDVIPAAGDKRPSAAMVLTSGTSREAALKAANDALACLRIVTQ